VNVRNLVRSFECVRCGAFRCDHYAIIRLRRIEWSAQQIGVVRGYVRRNQGLFLQGEDVEQLASRPTPSVGEKAAQLLLGLSQEHPRAGESFWAPVWGVQKALAMLEKYGKNDELPEEVSSDHSMKDLRWLAVISAADASELDWFVFVCLMGQGLIGKGVADGQITITMPGWQEITRLQQINARSRIAFVAMSFLPTFTPLFETGIMPAIEAAGYRAERVDRTEHNNRIDDEIIARIRQSRFLVADFTKQRGGIYFEAGYALGLGLPVIWLARESALKKVHFDNRQYNFIPWREGAWEELRQRLRFRIEATIGLGPLPQQE
jgi:hypothetical protein